MEIEMEEIIPDEELEIEDVELDVIKEYSGAGTSDYTKLENKPQINGVELVGNMTTKELEIMQSYNVKDYGAVGDGITDDTEAFRKCIMEANGNQVIVPAGTYAVNHLEPYFIYEKYIDENGKEKQRKVYEDVSINMIGINRPTIIRTKVQDPNPSKADYRAIMLFNNVKYAKITGIDFDSKRDDFLFPTGTKKEYKNYMSEIEYKGGFYFDIKNSYKKRMSPDYEGALIPVQPGEKFKITARTTSSTVLATFYSEYNYKEGTATGETMTYVSLKGESSKTYTNEEVIVPEGCYWMGVNSYTKSSYSGATPLYIEKEVTVDTYEWFGTAVFYFVGGGRNIEIDHCNFMNTSREAIYCKGNFENVHVHDCTFNDVSANFWSRKGNMTNFVFENNTSNRCRTMAVEFDTENGFQSRNLLIKNNRFTDIVKSAVTLVNCRDVVIEGNYYSYFDTDKDTYSEYMGVVDASPYFVWMITDVQEDATAGEDFSSNVVIRNNKGIARRAVSLMPSSDTTVNGNPVTDEDIFYKNIEIYNNKFDISDTFVSTNNSQNVQVYNNYANGTIQYGFIHPDSVGITAFGNVIEPESVNVSQRYKLIHVANLIDGELSVNGVDYTDICSIKLTETSTLKTINMKPKIGSSLLLFVKDSDLIVETDGNILNAGTITANNVARFIFYGTKWILMN